MVRRRRRRRRRRRMRRRRRGLTDRRGHPSSPPIRRPPLQWRPMPRNTPLASRVPWVSWAPMVLLREA
eukprot:6103946-Pyramimonas_sp.AAC.1